MTARVATLTGTRAWQSSLSFDPVLLTAAGGLMLLGLVMVASASLSSAQATLLNRLSTPITTINFIIFIVLHQAKIPFSTLLAFERQVDHDQLLAVRMTQPHNHFSTAIAARQQR